MAGITKWSFAIVVSVTVHLGLGAVISPFLEPRAVSQSQSGMAARASVTTASVPQARATERNAQSDIAEPLPETGQSADLGTIPVARAAPTDLPVEPAVTAPPSGQIATESDVAADPGGVIAPAALSATSQQVDGQALAATSPVAGHIATVSVEIAAQSGAAISPQQASAALQEPRAEATSPSAPEAIVTGSVEPRTQSAQASAISAETSVDASSSAAVQALGAATAATQTASASAPVSQSAAQTPPAAEPVESLTAWSGDLTITPGQPTLDTAAALRVAGGAGGALRDALADEMGAIACGRVQTAYDPESGAVDLRGHVPDAAARARLVSGLEAQIDDALPLNDRLRLLGEPQCGVLGQLSAMRLAQSVEQNINPMMIGEDLYARVYGFQAGETVRFELAGADYDGWLTLDYYDAEGQVLHILPNEQIAPVFVEAQARVVFGGGGAEDVSGGRLALRVSPPFGQDIAVAIITSEPIFDAPRPLVEPASAYLEALTQRIDGMRLTDPAFRGEWAYLFVETAAAP
ncbi:MAG: DUF4384 domain-containing protein [Pseudomonadota bacterium]